MEIRYSGEGLLPGVCSQVRYIWDGRHFTQGARYSGGSDTLKVHAPERGGTSVHMGSSTGQVQVRYTGVPLRVYGTLGLSTWVSATLGLGYRV